MKNVFGGIMLGCGILIAGVSGLCSLLIVGSALIDAGSSNSDEMAYMIPAVLIFCGIPIAIGIGLFFAGRSLMKSPPPAPYVPPVPPEEVKRAAPPEMQPPENP